MRDSSHPDQPPAAAGMPDQPQATAGTPAHPPAEPAADPPVGPPADPAPDTPTDPAGAPPGQQLVAADPPAPAALDAHGYDPALYKWLPVLRKQRADGWTPQRQRDFIAALADCGVVEQARQTVNMSRASCSRLRRESPAFAAAWEAAIAHAANGLVDIAFDRAFNGTDMPVFDKDGRRIASRRQHSDRLLMFLLRAYKPERFRHAHKDVRDPGEAPPAAAAPLEETLERLAPVTPEAPEQLMSPDELEDALEIADILEGELPHWERGQGDATPSTWESPIKIPLPPGWTDPSAAPDLGDPADDHDPLDDDDPDSDF